MIKRKIFFLFSFLISTTVFAQENFSPLEITKVKENYFVCVTYHDYKGSPYPANCMYVVCDSGVILIDSPWDANQTIPLLDTIEARHHKKVILCIATHFHADRTGAFDILKSKGVKTYASKLTNKFAKKSGDQQAEFIFTKDTVFTFGNFTFETFYPGEGHTKDNIVIWFPDAKILYGGCFIKSIDADGIGNLSDANVKKWPSSIQKTQQKYPDPFLIIPGHESWSDKRAYSHTAALLRDLR